MIPDAEIPNFDLFKDCLSSTVISKLAPNGSGKPSKRVKGRKNEIKPVRRVAAQNGEDDGQQDSANDLAEFIEVGSGANSLVCRYWN